MNAGPAMKAYLVGSGIASLAAAVYLLRGAGMKPSDVTVYESEPTSSRGEGFPGAHPRVDRNG